MDIMKGGRSGCRSGRGALPSYFGLWQDLFVTQQYDARKDFTILAKDSHAMRRQGIRDGQQRGIPWVAGTLLYSFDYADSNARGFGHFTLAQSRKHPRSSDHAVLTKHSWVSLSADGDETIRSGCAKQSCQHYGPVFQPSGPEYRP